MKKIDKALCFLFCALFLFQLCPAPSSAAREETLYRNLLEKAEGYYQRGYYRTAIRLFRAAEGDGSGFVLPPRDIFILGLCHYRLKEYNEAVDIFIRLTGPAEDYRADPGAWRDRQRRFSSAGIDPDELRHYLTFSLAGSKKWEEATPLLEEVVGSSPSGPERVQMAILLSQAYLETDHPEKAVPVLKDIYARAEDSKEHSRVGGILEEAFGRLHPEKIIDLIDRGMINESDAGMLAHRLEKMLEGGQEKIALEIVGAMERAGWMKRAPGILDNLMGRAVESKKEVLVKIGVLLPLSGDYEVFGKKILQAFNLALADAADLDVILVIRDTAGDAGVGVEAANGLIDNDHVSVIVGPILSSVAEGVVRVAHLKEVPVLSPAAQSPDLPSLSPYFFRNCITLEQQAREMARAAVNGLGFMKFAILAPEDNYGKIMTRSFWDEVLRLGGEVLAFENYSLDQTDFNEQIKAVKGEPAEKEEEKDEDILKTLGLEEEEEDFLPPFDAIYLPDSFYRVGLIAPQLPFNDIDGDEVTIIGTSGLNSPRFVEIGEDYVEGAIMLDAFFADRQDIGVREFVSHYTLRYGSRPDTLAAQAYDAARIILHLIRRGLTLPEEIRYGLATLENFPGVCGPTGMDGDGESVRKPFFLTVFRGRLAELKIDYVEDPIHGPFPLTVPDRSDN